MTGLESKTGEDFTEISGSATTIYVSSSASTAPRSEQNAGQREETGRRLSNASVDHLRQQLNMDWENSRQVRHLQILTSAIAVAGLVTFRGNESWDIDLGEELRRRTPDHSSKSTNEAVYSRS